MGDETFLRFRGVRASWPGVEGESCEAFLVGRRLGVTSTRFRSAGETGRFSPT